MKLRQIVYAVLLAVTGCQAAEHGRPRFAPIVSLTTAQLWDVGFRQAATQELTCEGMARLEAGQWLSRRFGAQERRIAARLGEKSAEEIILTLPPCSHFRGAVDRYADALRELEKRL